MKNELHGELLLAAVSYADRWQWPVAPGLNGDRQGERSYEHEPIQTDGSAGRCDHGVPLPTLDARKIVEWWTRFPDASVRTPAGYIFDAVSAPEKVGNEAISRIASVGIRAWSAFGGCGRIVFLLQRGLADDLRLRVGRPQDGQGLRIYSTNDLLMLPPSQGMAWLQDAGPLASYGAESHELLPTLVAASARHAIPLRLVPGRLNTHPMESQPSRAPRSAGPAADPSCRRSRPSPLMTGELPHSTRPSVGSRHMPGPNFVPATSRGPDIR
jgi:bifunctional DNA primase/polymerase-like protein